MRTCIILFKFDSRQALKVKVVNELQNFIGGLVVVFSLPAMSIRGNREDEDSVSEDNILDEDSVSEDNILDEDSVSEDNILDEDSVNEDSVSEDNILDEDSVSEDNILDEDSVNEDSVSEDNVIDENSVIEDKIGSGIGVPMHSGNVLVQPDSDKIIVEL
ncbi:hypothetical protein TNCV_3637401 [Trichonephila clavipes]|nr:hypothetical protein TNCV_3637401 [Trichonephila clavipes]